MCTSGRPFQLIDVRIVDSMGRDVPKDGASVGEVLVHGPTVFSGYLGLRQATAESFSPGEWFHTGDLAIGRPDGYLLVVDRKKDMLLVGGENVYTTEVESVLHAHPAVHQAAVFGVPNRVMGELVAAAVTVAPDVSSPPTSKELIAWCKERLAEYKVPATVHVIEKMPTTGSGKILKTELRKMFGGLAAVPVISAQSRLPIAQQTAPVGDLNPFEMAIELSRSCGGNTPALLVDSALGADVGKDIFPQLTYIALLDGFSGGFSKVKMLWERLGVQSIVAVCLQRQNAIELLKMAGSGKTANLVILHVPLIAFLSSEKGILRSALAAAKLQSPPFAGVVYWSHVEEKVPAAPPESTNSASLVFQAASKPDGAGPSLRDITKAIMAAISTLLDSAATEKIAAGEPFMAAGLNSTLAVQLVAALQDAFGTDIPATLVFDYPSLKEMTEFLAMEMVSKTVSISLASHGEATSAKKVRPLPPHGMLDVSARVPFSMPQDAPKSSASSGNKVVTAVIAQHVHDMLGPAEIAENTPLMAAGVNSTLAVQLVTALETAFGIELPGTLVFDYPTINEIALFVAELTDTTASGMADNLVASALAPGPPQEQRAVFVTAAAHEVPGGFLAPKSAHGNDRITLVPLERWDVDAPATDNVAELNLQFGSFLPDVASFDPASFGISPGEAVLMDPQQRLVINVFSVALAAHLATHEVSKETGVYVGVSQLDYARIAYETGTALNTYYATGSHLSVASGRLSYTYGLKGPAMTVDTACSSSLVTTHLASKALLEGVCCVAGTLGVNLTLVHSWTRACFRAGMLADDGRCKTLDISAGEKWATVALPLFKGA